MLLAAEGDGHVFVLTPDGDLPAGERYANPLYSPSHLLQAVVQQVYFHHEECGADNPFGI